MMLQGNECKEHSCGERLRTENDSVDDTGFESLLSESVLEDSPLKRFLRQSYIDDPSSFPPGRSSIQPDMIRNQLLVSCGLDSKTLLDRGQQSPRISALDSAIQDSDSSILLHESENLSGNVTSSENDTCTQFNVQKNMKLKPNSEDVEELCTMDFQDDRLSAFNASNPFEFMNHNEDAIMLEKKSDASKDGNVIDQDCQRRKNTHANHPVVKYPTPIKLKVEDIDAVTLNLPGIKSQKSLKPSSVSQSLDDTGYESLLEAQDNFEEVADQMKTRDFLRDAYLRDSKSFPPGRIGKQPGLVKAHLLSSCGLQDLVEEQYLGQVAPASMHNRIFISNNRSIEEMDREEKEEKSSRNHQKPLYQSVNGAESFEFLHLYENANRLYHKDPDQMAEDFVPYSIDTFIKRYLYGDLKIKSGDGAMQSYSGAKF